MSEFDGLVLDFDGVMADSEGGHTSARLQAFETLGYTLDPVLHAEAHNHGSTPNEIIGWVLKASGVIEYDADVYRHPAVIEAVSLKSDIYFEDASMGLEAVSGALPFIEWAVARFGRRLAIATTAYRTFEVTPYLQRHNLEGIFSWIVAREDTPEKAFKPDSFVYRRATELTQAERSLAVEDSPRGITSAVGAGLFTVGITTTRPAAKLRQANLVVASFDEIHNYIAAA